VVKNIKNKILNFFKKPIKTIETSYMSSLAYIRQDDKMHWRTIHFVCLAPYNEICGDFKKIKMYKKTKPNEYYLLEDVRIANGSSSTSFYLIFKRGSFEKH